MKMKDKVTHSKEEKQAYFKNLREEWKKSKELSENDETAKALFREVGGSFSYTSFYFTLRQMRAHNMEGTPYIDAKTFQGWKQAGFIVKKGEKSKINGITWIDANIEKETEEKMLYPKQYYLFHKSQVEALA